MRKFIPVFMALMMFSGCGLPYRSAVFRQIQTSSTLNQAVNEMGAAMYHGKALTDAARKEIKAALDDQVQAHAICLYALEQYQLYQGMTGYEPLENELNRLYNATVRVADMVHKHLGIQLPAPQEGDAKALIELFMELPEADKKKILEAINGD